jgi:hypothetical protein
MTSVSSFRTRNLAHACQNFSLSHHLLFSNEDHPRTPLLQPLLMTVMPSLLLLPPDPRKFRFISTNNFHTHSLSLLLLRLSRKFSLNENKRTPPTIQRRSSLPPAPRTHTHTHANSSSPHPGLVTIPLRPCCPNCFSATERATLQGDEWTERFTHAARRRRSASVDHRPCPPHVVAGSGTTIQWSTVAEHPSNAFRSFLVLDEVDHAADLEATDVASTSKDRELEQGLEHLSVQDAEDGILPPLLTRQGRWLSPIPSNNPSADNLVPACTVAEGVGILPLHRPFTSASVSPPRSPSPQTPSSDYSTPISSPTISSASSQSERGSPRTAGSFRVPKGATIMRAGADILKGVSVLGGGPI